MSKNFAHIHVHTQWSLLDGLAQIDRAFERASELEMPALGITDHGNMHGVIDFFRAGKTHGVKPVIGMEAYLAPRKMTDRDSKIDRKPFHMLLIAENDTGYKNLLRLASMAQLQGYYYYPRIDRELMAEYSEGIIATSGCLASEIPRMVQRGREEEAKEKIGWYADVFGEDNFFLELQPHDIDDLEHLNRFLVRYRQSGHTGVQLVATNDVHYVMRDDAEPHDALLCVQTGSYLNKQDRMKLSPFGSYYMKTEDEMRDELNMVPRWMVDEALANTVEIANRTNVNLESKGYHLPIFPVPDDYDEKSYLEHLVNIGMKWRYGDGWKSDSNLVERVDRELQVIDDMGFNSYFLIVWDLCEFARYEDIWWNVRGSGAGSVVAYSLGITNVDPIKNSLLFERFLNKGRVSMPDIDLDYQDDRRHEMIAYCVDRYGSDKVAAIVTFGTLKARSAVRDIARVSGFSVGQQDHIAKLIPQEVRSRPIPEYIEQVKDLQHLYKKDERVRKVLDTADRVQGVPRNSSQHAAGFIVSDKPLVEYVPLSRLKSKEDIGALEAATQFTMETVEELGLLKVDFLGLSTLTHMRKCCELIAQRHGIHYDLDNIPFDHDDPRLTDEDRQMLDEAFEMMGRGETIGVFQIESSGMQKMLRMMKPFNYQHIIAGVALYRPGPMDLIPTYVARMHKEEPIEYVHDALQPILEETFGICVFQEQILQIAGKCFGYPLHEADLMRRAVSKKKVEKLQEHRGIFRERGPENGIDADSADKVFDFIEKFADYGFNRSHATDYGVMTVQSAFLKCHYPEEFMASALAVYHTNSDKVSTFIQESRRMGIEVNPPSVNHSDVGFVIEDGESQTSIRYGMSSIKNASVAGTEAIAEERKAKGPFTSLEDLCKRVSLSKVGKRTMEALITVGALDELGDRATLLYNIDSIMGFGKSKAKAAEVGQMSLFSFMGMEEEDAVYLEPVNHKMGDVEQLRLEKEYLGVYISGRPTDSYTDKLEALDTDNILDLKQECIGDEEKHLFPCLVAGEVVETRKITTAKDNEMAFVTIEDWNLSANRIQLTVFPSVYSETPKRLFEPGAIIAVKGKLDTIDYRTGGLRDELQIIADDISEVAKQNLSATMDDHWV